MAGFFLKIFCIFATIKTIGKVYMSEKLEVHLENVLENGYCRVEVIAQLFGLTVRRIQQLTQDGVIPTTVTKTGRRLYELGPTVQRYTKYLSDKAYGKSQSEKEKELKVKKMQADIALKESQGELHRLKTEIATGKYIDIEQVKMDYGRFFVVFKKFALSLPPRCCGRIINFIDPTEARQIEKEINEDIIKIMDDFVVAGVSPEDLEKPKRKTKKGTGGGDS